MTCEHGYYASKCPRCPRRCYRCNDTGQVQCGDNNTGMVYPCTEFGACAFLAEEKRAP